MAVAEPSGVTVFCGRISRATAEQLLRGCRFRSDTPRSPRQPVGPNASPGLALEALSRARGPTIGPRAEGEPGALARPNKPLVVGLGADPRPAPPPAEELIGFVEEGYAALSAFQSACGWWCSSFINPPPPGLGKKLCVDPNTGDRAV
jgi:hypothetical protein